MKELDDGDVELFVRCYSEHDFGSVQASRYHSSNS